ncbi:MAG: GNAT family N-acetyltransferase [Bacteroidia bacterium]|nr:GNAT family N-acetyltransferase [Bacteroidia bacterium]
MQVKEVINLSDARTFLQVPKVLYRYDAEWVCPLDKDIKEIFDPLINKNFEHGEAKRWILWDKKKPIGRVAAFYNSTNFIAGELKTGGIGFFECINEEQAATMLFDTCKNWFRTKGIEAMDGPVNFGEKDKFWGLMVAGFSNPSYQENYNFPYYQNLFENYGFTKILEQTTSEASFEKFNFERFIKLASRVYNNPVYRFEHYRASQQKKYAADFISIYNQAWAHRSDFVPITTERIETTLGSLKPIMLEEAIWFAYAHNEPAGFYVNVLDVNQIFKHLKGKLNLWGKLKFLWFRKFGQINRIRGIVFGVIPKYQNLGIETGMMIKVFNAMKKYPAIKTTELSWIGDFNPKMHSLFNALGAQTTKVHYTYRMEIEKF